MAEETEGNPITLLDEDGTEHEFQHLASLEYNDSTYVALVPAYEEPEEVLDSDGELVILKVVYDEETHEDVLEAIEDENEYDTVAEQFEEMLGDDYDFIDEESDEDSENDDDEK